MTDGAPPGSDGVDDPSASLGTSLDRETRLASLLAVDIGASPDTGTSLDTRMRVRQRRSSERDPKSPSDAVDPVPESGDQESGDESPDDDPRGLPPTRTLVAFVALAVLFVAGLGLAYAGVRLVRTSTAGQVLAPIEDPDAPGFEAVVDATPTIALFHTVGSKIDAVTVLTLPDPDGGGGGVLLVPTRIITEIPILGDAPLEAAYDLGNAGALTESLGTLLGTAVGETTEIDAARWAELVAPVSPLRLDNPDDVIVDGQVLFAQGELELDAADVGTYLETTGEGESDLARLFRHQVFWETWLDAVGAAGRVDAVPGEVETGIGRFVRSLARGDEVVATLPVDPELDRDEFGPEPLFVVDGDRTSDVVDRLVPFPVSPAPGTRARVRLLNGTVDTSAASSVAADLPPAGVQVVLIGNATTFGEMATTVRHASPEFRDEAAAIVDILGVGEVVEDPRPSDAADITVTLGADYG